ncbi:MAG TPA: sterol desaturase family protein [bacterium]|nr:sterol desaturase family protein [bacterium]
MAYPALEMPIRLFFFLLAFLALGFLEAKNQWVPLNQDREERWLNHLGLAFAGAILIRTFLPLAALSFAWWVADHRFGLFNQVEVPLWLSVPWTILALDWALYYGHRALHAVPPLWKCHRVHHTDLDLDVSTGLRFHLLETAFSMLVRFLVILALGCPTLGVLWFEVLYTAALLFGHANLRLSPGLQKILGIFLVTPASHRVHHSRDRAQANRNFGFIFTWWDWIFGTYLDKREDEARNISVGVEGFEPPSLSALPNLLAQPFSNRQGDLSMENFKSPESAYTQNK